MWACCCCATLIREVEAVHFDSSQVIPFFLLAAIIFSHLFLLLILVCHILPWQQVADSQWRCLCPPKQHEIPHSRCNWARVWWMLRGNRQVLLFFLHSFSHLITNQCRDTKKAITDAGVHRPTGDKIVHVFSWHGQDPDSPNGLKENKRVFQKFYKQQFL